MLTTIGSMSATVPVVYTKPPDKGAVPVTIQKKQTGLAPAVSFRRRALIVLAGRY